MQTNYLKGGDATWWNNQLSSNYSLYNTNNYNKYKKNMNIFVSFPYFKNIIF
jgi:hypothetical protein